MLGLPFAAGAFLSGGLAAAAMLFLNRQTQLKFTPKLQFRIDDTFDTVTRLEGIMHNIKYSDQE